MTELDDAIALRPGGEGRWLAFADPRREAANGMFGGWTAAVMLQGILRSADGGATPSAISVNFVDKVTPGIDVQVRTSHVGGGRSVDHWQAELVSPGNGGALANLTAVLTERRETDGHAEPVMPDAPDPESLEVFHPPGPHGERHMMRPVEGHPPFGRADTYSSAWVRETSGRPVDHVQLAYLADGYAPRSFFWSDGPRPSATLTMSVFFHATDDEIAAIGDDDVLLEAIGTRGASSTSGQQARLWSRVGDLLLTSEQLCWYR